MKHLRIISLLFLCFTILFSYLAYPHSASAGAAKVIYEIGETTTEAMIKAVKARKGFKLVEGGAETVEASDDFVRAVSKGLQETAAESWTVINGAALNATPVAGMPGWLKATVGTALFITGLDSWLEVYNYYQDTGDVKTLEITDVNKEGIYDVFFGYTLWKMHTENNPNMAPNIQQWAVNMKGPDGEFVGWCAGGPGPHCGFTSYMVDEPDAHLKFIPASPGNRARLIPVINYRYGNEDRVNTFYWIYADNLDPSLWVSAPIKQPALPLTQEQVQPNFDPNAEEQVIYFPDPAVFPDVEKEINKHWEWITAPGTYDVNPNPDPDPDPDPGTDPNAPPDKNFWTKLITPIATAASSIAQAVRNLPNQLTKIGEGVQNISNITSKCQCIDLPPIYNPFALILPYLQFLLAAVVFVGKVVVFAIALPSAGSVSIDNEAFQWFRSAEIMGVPIYNTISTLATAGVSFLIYKIVRKNL